ncbi:MAG: SEC-C metal-binding domain-containing protein [Acidobacteriota bacterium]
MSKIGRNDPCPCGSGKKYKSCCLTGATTSDFLYRRFRHVHSELLPQLTDFAFETVGPEIVAEAWKDFDDQQSLGNFDPESTMYVLFMPWFLFSWILEMTPHGSDEFCATTIAELFLINEQGRLNADEELLLRSSIRSPYTLAEVIGIKPGQGMTLLDLLRRTKYEVAERTASETLKRGEIIYCATSDFAGLKTNVGTGPYALRPTAKRDVLELRKWMNDEIGADNIEAEHLHEFEYDIRGLYLHILRGMLRPPTLTNTDGDPLVQHKIYFDIESSDQTFQALKGLAKGRSENELLRDATTSEGLVVKAEISWLGGTREARKRLGGPVLLGLLKIDENHLVVEVNSKQRASRIRRLVEKRLGNKARYRTTLIESIESQVEKMWQSSADDPFGVSGWSDTRTGGAAGLNSVDDLQPEMRDAMKRIARQHWAAWFDLPVPALNDMTPREAAKTEEGRELLESLLLLYEGHQSRDSDNLMAPDISYLRRELGMDQQRK